jgi:F-box/WD-40 domain protein 7
VVDYSFCNSFFFDNKKMGIFEWLTQMSEYVFPANQQISEFEPLVLVEDEFHILADNRTELQNAFIIVSTSADNTIRVWANGAQLRKLEGQVSVTSMLQVGPGTIATGGLCGYIYLWDINTGDCISAIHAHSKAVMCMIKIDDMTIVSGGQDGVVKMWDLRTGILVRTLEGHEGPVEAIIQDGSRLISSSTDWTIRIWDQDGEAEILRKHTDPVHCLVMLNSDDTMFASGNSDDTMFASGSSDETIRIWKNGKSIMTLVGHLGPVRALCQMNDKYLVSGSEDETIRIYSITVGTCLYVLEEHTGHVLSLSTYLTDFIISGSQDGTIKIWCVRTGECVSTLLGHDDKVTSVMNWQYLIPQHILQSRLSDYIRNRALSDVLIILIRN